MTPHYATFALALVSNLAIVAKAEGQVRPPADPVVQVARDLQTDLTELLRQAAALTDVAAAAVQPVQLHALTAAIDRVRADDLLLGSVHEQVEQRLKLAGASIAMQRQQATASAVRTRLDGLGRLFDEVTAAAGPPFDAVGFRAALDALVVVLQEAVATPDRAPLGASLPYRSLDLAVTAPETGPPVVPAYLDPQPRPPQPQDSAASPDVPLDDAIVAQARALRRSPIDIYQFVANEVAIEFYHGAMKGARATLRERSGNAVDQASLLIALMRASGVPARYVRGVIELPASQMFAWTGVSTTRRATELLTQAGIPHRPIRQGGAITAYQIEHTWAEVSVAYANYRGAPLDPRARSWIPLDPSIKSYQFAAGLDVLSSIGFSAGELVPAYLSAPQAATPLEFYKKTITDYLALNRPATAFEQAIARWTLQPVSPGLLPSTLPYRVIAITSETATLPDALRHHVRFVAQGDDGVSFDVRLAASDLVGQRVTLSYIPATVDDQTVVDAFLTLDNTPAYLVKLRPVLKLGGVVRAAGEVPIQMGALHDFTVEMQAPSASVPIVNALVAGGYYAVGLGSSRFTWQAPPVAAPDDTERPAADLLFGLAATYMTRWNEAEDTVAHILGAAMVRPMLSEVIVGNVYNRTLLFGAPQAIDWRGVFVDADLRIAEPVAIGNDDGARTEVLALSALAGSMLESEVLETNLQVDSVSAAKLIQLARASGITVDEINTGNVTTALAALSTTDVVKAHIADLVNQGLNVTVPRTELNVNQWSGIGYIARDPLTAAAGYFISGTLAGGMTSLTPEQWVQQQYVNELGHPYAGPANPDPLAAANITKISSTDKQNAVAGNILAAPLAVWVRDAAGKPVQSADVTFSVQTTTSGSGNPEFPGGNQHIIVQTDALGIARADLRVGKRTGDFPFYVKLNPSDQHATQVGQIIVHAVVNGSQGALPLDAPFQLFTHPDVPHHITKVLGDHNFGHPSTFAGTLQVRVEDQYDNPISNVPVDFSVGPAVLNPPLVGSLPAAARNMVLYPFDPPCEIAPGVRLQSPVLGDCNGQPSVTGVRTSVFGAFVETILGDTVATLFTVNVTAPGVPLKWFSLVSTGSRFYGARTFLQPALAMSLVQLRNDRDGNLNAAKVGTAFARPLGVVVYLLEDNYELEPLSTPCPQPQDPCFKLVSTETTRVRAIDVQRAGAITYRQAFPLLDITKDKAAETAQVTFTPVAGGGTVDPSTVASPGPANPGNGQYYSRLTVGPSAALNTVEVAAQASVWVPCFDLHSGAVEPKLLQNFSAGQRFTNFQDCAPAGRAPAASGPPAKLTHEVFGVKATMQAMPKPVVPMNRNGGTAVDVPLRYTIEPPEYAAQLAQVDLYEIDAATSQEQWIGAFNGLERSGNGFAPMFQGTGVDATKHHTMRLVLNRGSDAEVKGDSIPTAVFAHARIGEIRSNQIPNARANFLPGGSGRDCNASACKPYLVVGARSDGRLRILADVEAIGPSGLMVAGLRKKASFTSDSAPASAVSFTTGTDLFRILSTDRPEDYIVVAGADVNRDGLLSDDEVLDKSWHITGRYVIGISQSAYNAAKDDFTILANTLGLGVLDARSVLLAFNGGAAPNDSTTHTDTITFNSPYLQHNTGANWDANGNATIKRYRYGPASGFANHVYDSAHFAERVVADTLTRNADAILTALGQTSASSVTVPFPVVAELNFPQTDSQNLFAAFGGAHFEGDITVTVARTFFCATVSSVRVTGQVTDLYDWDMDVTGAWFLDTWGAALQAGYPTLGTAGAIFWNQIDLNGPLVDFTFDFFPPNRGTAALCSQVKLP